MPTSILFLTACLIWGSTFFAITLQLGEVAPAVSVVYRFGLASAALFAWCVCRGDKLALPWRTQRWMMLQGAASFCLSYICTYTSEQYLVSAVVAVLFVLMVFWNPIFSRIAFGHALTWRVWSAALVALAGVTLLFWQPIAASLRELSSGQGNGHFLLGLMLALTATMASSFGNMVVVKVRQYSSNVLLTMAWSMLWGTLLVAAWVIVSGQSFSLPHKASYWAGLLYLSLFGSVIAFAAYFTLIHRIGAHKAVYIGVVTPVISVVLSMQLEHFRPGAMESAGMLLCLSSVAWALRPDVAALAPASTEAETEAEPHSASKPEPRAAKTL